MSDIQKLVDLSVYAGQRFDWVQAGGGNTSVQIDDGSFYVKSSGINLTEMTDSTGFVKLSKTGVEAILSDEEILNIENKAAQEIAAREKLEAAVLGDGGRASIETYMHVLFKKFVLHTHPIGVNVIACRESWRDEFLRIFPGSLCVAYATPGFPLALTLKHGLDKFTDRHGHFPSVVFIQNHGLIVSGDTVTETIELAEDVADKVNLSLGRSDEPYNLTTRISRLMAEAGYSQAVAKVCTDGEVMDILEQTPALLHAPRFSPDGVTFCGFSTVELDDLENPKPVIEYFNRHGVMPRVVFYCGYLFTVAENLRKAKEIEDVLKFHLTVIKEADRPQSLGKDEESYLTHWEAEKYRQNL